MAKLNKSKVLELIVDALRDSLAVLQKAARASHAEATHESSKAENKYDTRGLEAAYLAGGQARQVAEIVKAMEVYSSLSVRQFGTSDPIDLTAVVEVETGREMGTYFIGPSSGGLEVLYQGTEITVITPQSPLGQQLMGKKTGERWTTNLKGARVNYRIVSVR